MDQSAAQVGGSTHSKAESTPTSIALAFCALGLFVLAFLGKALVRIPMENSGMGISVEEDCAMDNALPLPGSIVDGQQDVVHTNMYVCPFFLFFLQFSAVCLLTRTLPPPCPTLLPFQCGA